MGDEEDDDEVETVTEDTKTDDAPGGEAAEATDEADGNKE